MYDYLDTDSVFVLCPGATVEQADAFGYVMEKVLTAQFVPPIELEYEKMFVRTMLIKRKNYIYVPKGVNRVKYQGGEQVKRDYCSYFQNAYDTIANFLFLDILPDDMRQKFILHKEKAVDMLAFIRNALAKIQNASKLDDAEPTYYQFTRDIKQNQMMSLEVLDALSKRSAEKLLLEREQRQAYQPLPVSRAQRELQIAYALRCKQSFIQGSDTNAISISTLTDAMMLLHMFIADIRDFRNLDIDKLQALTMSCRLNGKYDSRKLAEHLGIEKASIAPYDERAWAVPNNGSIHLARRVRERARGQEPSIGERFSFINVLHTDRADLKIEQLETVDFAVANNLPIDLNAYLEKNGMPFQKLFGIAGAGYVCGLMLDQIMHEVNEEVNREIRLQIAAKKEEAKRNFFQPTAKNTAVVSPHIFNERKLKASNAAKANKKADAGAKRISDFFSLQN